MTLSVVCDPTWRAKEKKRGTKDEEFRESKRLAKQIGIQINTAKYHKQRTDVPSQLRSQFDTILVLGDIKYLEYQECSRKPWQSDIKRKALRLTHMAGRFRDEHHNEGGWRDAIESKIFERFDIEVACKRCRGRLWRSEIEVDSSTSNSRTASLADRQKRRDACTCDPLQREDEHSSMDPGISNLFSYRIDTAVEGHNKSPPKTKKRPDRIHGLRRTENFDVHLRSPYLHNDCLSRTSLVEDAIRTSIHRKYEDAELLFPFLILEAKSEKGAASFEEMEMQVCFPIQQSLQLQWELLQAPGNAVGVPGAPLVWSFIYRGEDWRVYAGHVELSEGRPKYLINYLWGGSVTGIDETLQLLLIVDYIVDWARDTFRPNIFRQVKSLASGVLDDRATVDPDVVSLNGEIENWMAEQSIDEDSSDEPTEEPPSPPQLLLTDRPSHVSRASTLDPFEQQFTSTLGLVKDARRISSRLKGLWIKRDSLDFLFQAFKTPNQVESFARQVLVTLKRQGVVINGAEVLGAVEELWTGQPDGHFAGISRKTRIHVQFQISFYINSVWEIVRELTYLAVEEDALELLLERAAYKRRGQVSPPQCRKDRLTAAVSTLLDSGVQEDLLSALCRRTYVLGFEHSTVIVVDDYNAPEERQESRPIFQQAKNAELERSGLYMQSLVRDVFNTIQSQTENHVSPVHQRVASILRASSRIDVEERPLWKVRDPLARNEKSFLVYSDVPSTRHLADLARRRYCLYVVDNQQVELTQFSIASRLIATVQQREVYYTVRRARAPGSGNMKNWRDNRDDFSRPYLGPLFQTDPIFPPDHFRNDVCDWIKTFAQPVRQGPEEMASLLSSWYFSAGAVAALRPRHRFNAQDKTWTSWQDASQVSTLV